MKMKLTAPLMKTKLSMRKQLVRLMNGPFYILCSSPFNTRTPRPQDGGTFHGGNCLLPCHTTRQEKEGLSHHWYDYDGQDQMNKNPPRPKIHVILLLWWLSSTGWYEQVGSGELQERRTNGRRIRPPRYFEGIMCTLIMVRRRKSRGRGPMKIVMMVMMTMMMRIFAINDHTLHRSHLTSPTLAQCSAPWTTWWWRWWRTTRG